MTTSNCLCPTASFVCRSASPSATPSPSCHGKGIRGMGGGTHNLACQSHVTIDLAYLHSQMANKPPRNFGLVPDRHGQTPRGSPPTFLGNVHARRSLRRLAKSGSTVGSRGTICSGFPVSVITRLCLEMVKRGQGRGQQRLKVGGIG